MFARRRVAAESTSVGEERITVFLADDNLIVREGVRALLSADKNLEVVGVAADYDELVAGAEATEPNVVVTDIRMPPNFAREGIDAAKEIRKRHPGTGIVILSQYDDPDYAVSLLAEDAVGLRLSAEGSRRRRRPVVARDRRGRQRRFDDRPDASCRCWCGR